MSLDIGNHLVVMATERTKQRISDMLLSAPLQLDDVETFHVTLFVTPGRVEMAVPLDEAAIYKARVIKFGAWYDTVAGHSKLVAFLHSPEMVTRNAALMAGLGEFPYQPHLTFCHSMPPLSRSIKAFVASIANTLCSREEEPFTFQGEMLMQFGNTHISSPHPDDMKSM